MAPSTRDRISVDLRGLKAALVARSQERGLSPSAFVRETLAAALDRGNVLEGSPVVRPNCAPHRIRFSLRMQRGDARAVLDAARKAGMTVGDFIAGLTAKAPALAGPAGPAAQLATLTESCSELATLSRNLQQLTSLLRQGSGRAALEYRQMLDSLNADVHAHLALATDVVAALQPLIRSSRQRASAAGF